MIDVWHDKKYVDRFNELYELKYNDILTYINILGLNDSDVLVDFGCGKGDFLLNAAKVVKKAIGVDLAAHQMANLRENIGDSNIQLIESPFLDCDLQNTIVTKGFARISLHHLTDDEKFIFFKKIGKYFQPHSQFLIYDVIFDFPLNELKKREKALIQEAEIYYAEQWGLKKNDILNTWFNEYPTDFTTWAAALKNGRFDVKQKWQITSFLGMILAEKAI